MEAEFFGEGLELAELFLLGGGLDGEGLAFIISGGVCDQGVVKAPGSAPSCGVPAPGSVKAPG